MKIEKLSKEEEERALELHNRAFVVDSASMPYIVQEGFLRKVREGGVDATLVTVIDSDAYNFISALKKIDKMYNEVERKTDKMLLVRNFNDVERAKEEKKLAIICAFQDSKPFLACEGEPGGYEYDLCILRHFYRLGVRSTQLAQTYKNPIGDGVGERTDGGLSSFGQEFIRELNRLGMLVDCTHSGRQTTLDAIETSKDPVIFSHSNVRSLCDNKRNITDEQIHACAEKGGVVGINCYSPFVTREHRPTIEDVLDHIDYIINLVGSDHVGTGLDLIEGWTEEERRYLAKRPDLYGASPEEQVFAEGIDTITKFPNITKGLVARGYSDQEIEKILGGNFLRVFKTVLR